MDILQEIQRRYNTTCNFMAEDIIGRIDTSWQPSHLPKSFIVQTYAFLKGVEGHPGVLSGYAWIGVDGQLIVMFKEGNVESPETAIAEYYARNSN